MYEEYVSFLDLFRFFLSPDAAAVFLPASFFSAGAFPAGALPAGGFFSAAFGAISFDFALRDYVRWMGLVSQLSEIAIIWVRKVMDEERKRSWRAPNEVILVGGKR